MWINYLENELESNETNKYEEFFNIYYLTSGQTIYNNDNIKHSYDKLYNVCFGTTIILIIFIVPCIVQWFLFCICGNDEEGIFLGCVEKISIFVIIFLIIVLFILFGLYLGFFI